MNLTGLHEDAGSIRAIALIRPPAWELPYAVGAALKRPKTKKNSIKITFILKNLIHGCKDQMRQYIKMLSALL